MHRKHQYYGNKKNNQHHHQDRGGGGGNMKSQKNRLFVGGIDASISEEDLEIYFSQFGEIMKAEVIRDKRTRISKGYGFIKCRDKDTAQIILNQRHRIGNRNIDVNNAAEKWETSTTKNNLYEKKLFISGITPNIENADLRRYFEDFGEVKNAYVILDPIKQRKKNFGYVEFFEREATHSVLNYQGKHIVNGTKITCSKYRDKGGKGGSDHHRRNNNNNNNRRGNGGYGGQGHKNGGIGHNNRGRHHQRDYEGQYHNGGYHNHQKRWRRGEEDHFERQEYQNGHGNHYGHQRFKAKQNRHQWGRQEDYNEYEYQNEQRHGRRDHQHNNHHQNGRYRPGGPQKQWGHHNQQNRGYNNKRPHQFEDFEYRGPQNEQGRQQRDVSSQQPFGGSRAGGVYSRKSFKDYDPRGYSHQNWLDEEVENTQKPPNRARGGYQDDQRFAKGAERAQEGYYRDGRFETSGRPNQQDQYYLEEDGENGYQENDDQAINKASRDRYEGYHPEKHTQAYYGGYGQRGNPSELDLDQYAEEIEEEDKRPARRAQRQLTHLNLQNEPSAEEQASVGVLSTLEQETGPHQTTNTLSFSKNDESPLMPTPYPIRNRFGVTNLEDEETEIVPGYKQNRPPRRGQSPQNGYHRANRRSEGSEELLSVSELNRTVKSTKRNFVIELESNFERIPTRNTEKQQIGANHGGMEEEPRVRPGEEGESPSSPFSGSPPSLNRISSHQKSPGPPEGSINAHLQEQGNHESQGEHHQDFTDRKPLTKEQGQEQAEEALSNQANPSPISQKVELKNSAKKQQENSKIDEIQHQAQSLKKQQHKDQTPGQKDIGDQKNLDKSLSECYNVNGSANPSPVLPPRLISRLRTAVTQFAAAGPNHTGGLRNRLSQQQQHRQRQQQHQHKNSLPLIKQIQQQRDYMPLITASAQDSQQDLRQAQQPPSSSIVTPSLQEEEQARRAGSNLSGSLNGRLHPHRAHLHPVINNNPSLRAQNPEENNNTMGLLGSPFGSRKGRNRKLRVSSHNSISTHVFENSVEFFRPINNNYRSHTAFNQHLKEPSSAAKRHPRVSIDLKIEEEVDNIATSLMGSEGGFIEEIDHEERENEIKELVVGEQGQRQPQDNFHGMNSENNSQNDTTREVYGLQSSREGSLSLMSNSNNSKQNDPNKMQGGFLKAPAVRVVRSCNEEFGEKRKSYKKSKFGLAVKKDIDKLEIHSEEKEEEGDGNETENLPNEDSHDKTNNQLGDQFEGGLAKKKQRGKQIASNLGDMSENESSEDGSESDVENDGDLAEEAGEGNEEGEEDEDEDCELSEGWQEAAQREIDESSLAELVNSQRPRRGPDILVGASYRFGNLRFNVSKSCTSMISGSSLKKLE